ncbi:MAG: hypothetical protein PHE38_15925 [Alishewanella agri]|nr:hypothetical protein [Alishewanella agri]
MDFLNFFLSILGGAASGMLAAVFLSKKFVEHQLQKDMERYRSTLELETEKQKSKLQLCINEQNIVLTRYDAERAEAIKVIYTKINAWRDSIHQLNHAFDHGGIELEHCIEASYSSAEDTWSNLKRNAILYPTNMFEELQNFCHSAFEMSMDIRERFINQVQNGNCPEDGITFEYVQEKAREYQDKHLEPLLGLLIFEFRKLLGAEKAT